MPLTLKRIQNYTTDGGITGYSTVIECCGKELPVAHVQNEANAAFLVNGWVKTLDPILDKYELGAFATKPKTVNDADSFIRAVVTSETYKEKYKENK